MMLIWHFNLAIKFEFDKLKENYFLSRRKAKTNKPTKKQIKDLFVMVCTGIKGNISLPCGCDQRSGRVEVGKQVPLLKGI